MAKGDSVAAEDGRLARRLAARLEPKLHDALDHPIRRELLRTLSRRGTPRTVAELRVELRAFRPGQLGYHLQVLRRSGAVASKSGGAPTASSHTRYASGVHGDGRVQALLRATERADRERREAAAAANASPLLTMFRIPRPIRTIRLRGRNELDAERDR
jgi:DNA-binding transcriptional ArsR family regulator